MLLRKIFNAAVLLLLLSSESVAQEAFTSYVFVNDVRFEEPVWVEYYSDNVKNTIVHISPLVEDLKSTVSESFIKKIKAVMSEDGKVKISDIENIGGVVDLDLDTLDIKITLETKDKKLTKLNLSNIKADGEIKNLVKPSPFSGYLNLRGGVELSGDERKQNPLGNQFQRTNAVSLESVFNMGGLVLENQFTYTTDKVLATKEYRRLYSRLVYDDQKNMVRYTLGDITDSVRGFQELLYGFGFNMKKEFSIKPSYFRSSFKKFKFYLDTNARVEVYINGNLVQKRFLPQGPVELSDFPFASGENEVTIKTIDNFGVVKVLDFSDLNDSRILPLGMSDFNISLMSQRTRNDLWFDLQDSYDIDNPLFSGFYHRGLFKNTVLGLDWQYKKDYSLFGLESLYGNNNGLLKFNTAYSSDKNLSQKGFAGRVEYESFLFKGGALSSFRLNFSGEYKDEEFSVLESKTTNAKYSLRASVSQNFKQNIRGSFGFAKEWSHTSGVNPVYLTSNFGWTFLKNFDFASSIRVDVDNSSNNVILLSLNWYSPHNNQQMVSVYDPVNSVVNAEYLSYPLDGRQNFRTFVSGEVNSASKRANVGFDYFNQRIETRASHSATRSDKGGMRQSTQVNLGTALAFTSRSIAVSRPIDNSFALVALSRRPKGYTVPIGRGENSRRGEINFWGPATLTNIAPYFLDRVNLDIRNLPYGYSLQKEAFKFKPTYKSGTYLYVKVDGEVSALGRAVYSNGKPAKYVVGNVYESLSGKKGEMIQSFFTGLDGIFSIESLEKKKYFIEFLTEEKSFKLIEISVNKDVGVYELERDLILEQRGG